MDIKRDPPKKTKKFIAYGVGLAAIVAVFSALGGGAPAPERPRSEWASPARRMRGPHVHYRGAWQASARGAR